MNCINMSNDTTPIDLFFLLKRFMSKVLFSFWRQTWQTNMTESRTNTYSKEEVLRMWVCEYYLHPSCTFTHPPRILLRKIVERRVWVTSWLWFSTTIRIVYGRAHYKYYLAHDHINIRLVYTRYEQPKSTESSEYNEKAYELFSKLSKQVVFE
jgi:hypothetical protein